MTENRCIEVLKKMKHMFTETCAKIDENTALNMAVEAIEEIQQYRAMEQKLQSVYGEHDGLLEIIVNGLVQYENAPDEAIKAVLLTDDDVDKWEAYKAIGTLDECRTAVERMKPKKDNNDCGRCKNCGTYNNFIINKLANPKAHPVIHCWNCGQSIDWNE